MRTSTVPDWSQGHRLDGNDVAISDNSPGGPRPNTGASRGATRGQCHGLLDRGGRVLDPRGDPGRSDGQEDGDGGRSGEGDAGHRDADEAPTRTAISYLRGSIRTVTRGGAYDQQCDSALGAAKSTVM
jgi:hypothetical protein